MSCACSYASMDSIIVFVTYYSQTHFTVSHFTDSQLNNIKLCKTFLWGELQVNINALIHMSQPQSHNLNHKSGFLMIAYSGVHVYM